MHINLNAMGTRMKRRRKELKMSQAELAEKVNVSNNHISSIGAREIISVNSTL